MPLFRASRLALSAVVLTALAAFALAASAAPNPKWPPPKESPPSVYADSQYWPSEWQAGGFTWEYLSWQPADGVQGSHLDTTLRGPEKGQPVGMSVDKAWSYTIGDPRVVLAYIDSGFLWDRSDLVNQWHLNAKELPVPQNVPVCPGGTAFAGGDHDANGDGVFNIQDYTTACGHEQPTVATLADTRITDANKNGIIDPEDLIAAFSDGTDADGNGFVDDICGWDFNWNDNDPFDDVLNGGQGYSHGSGRASDGAAEGNNGIGGLGICPRCQLMPLRGGEGFVGMSSQWAEAVIYAADNGASVISEAMGNIDNTPLMQAAMDYAYAKNVAMIASAGDETSYHHEYPANYEHSLYVHALSPDDKWEHATTFLNYGNCSNHGGHLALSTSTTSCSSEATSQSGGHAGLVYSMAVQAKLDPPLSAEECFQVMVMSADDIAVDGSANDPTKYASKPGWDDYFGWGRNNVYASVKMVSDGKIPPEVDVTAPKWFETLTPDDARKTAIVGRIHARRAADSVSWKVLVAPGVEPAIAAFQEKASGNGPVDGTIATLDLSSLIADPGATPHNKADFDKLTVTVWVQATAHYPDARGDVAGQFRKTFFIHKDPDLWAGFPVWLGASGESSPKLVDLDGDGKEEIVFATSDGRIHALRADHLSGTAHGTPLTTELELAGFPVRLGTYGRLDPQNPRNHLAAPAYQAGSGLGVDPNRQGEEITATLAIGDIDGDGKPDIVAATLGGHVFAFDAQGQPKSGFPVGVDPIFTATSPSEGPCFISRWPGECNPAGHKVTHDDATRKDEDWQVVERAFFASPVLADLDGDGKLEIVAAAMDGHLYAWHGNGQPAAGFPQTLTDPLRDRGLDHKEPNGRPVYKHMLAQSMGTPAIGDVDGDGKPDICAVSNEIYGANDNGARAYLFHADGTPFEGWPIEVFALLGDVLPLVGRGISIAPSMADVDGDGKDEMAFSSLTATAQFWKAEAGVGTGVDVQAHPFMTTGSDVGKKAGSKQQPFVALNSGSFADLDGDGKLEFLDGSVGAQLAAGASGGVRNDFDHQVSVWTVGKNVHSSCNGNQGIACYAEHFPQKVEDFQFFMNYAVGDMDGDGKPEMVSGSGGYLVTAFNIDGDQPAGFPKFTGGWIASTPALGDLDGDGYLDLVTVTREGWLYAWHTTGPATSIQWNGFHHDAMNTGRYETPLPKHKELSKGKKSCGSCGAEGGGLLALAAALLARRRRG